MTTGKQNMSVGLIGYGEVGKILCRALREQGVDWIGMWDIKLRDAGSADQMRAHAAQDGIGATSSMADLLSQADFVLSAVTASSTEDVAREAQQSIRPGSYFLDLNSASPETKRTCAQIIDGAGACYVEAGVMTSIPPYGIRVPMLLGGAKAQALADALTPLGFDMSVVSQEIGIASAVKMCRSVFIKGLEAIVIESFTTARRYGVEERVLASLHETFPTIDWEEQGAYFFSRVARHGKRRAEEMREAARTVREAGFESFMAAATAEKHAWFGALARSGHFDGVVSGANWREYAERIPRED